MKPAWPSRIEGGEDGPYFSQSVKQVDGFDAVLGKDGDPITFLNPKVIFHKVGQATSAVIEFGVGIALPCFEDEQGFPVRSQS